MLEDSGVLDPDNELHLLALHFVFLPRIRRSLESFQTAWNSHGLSSAQHSSPLQLWTTGMLMNRSLYRAVDEIFDYEDVQHRDPDQSEDDSDESENELESESSDESTNEMLDILRQTIDPLHASDMQGVELYAEALRIVLEY